MSRNVIEKNIGAFLELKSSEVLAVYGSWGVGKTYIWNDVIKNKRTMIPDCYKSYSYVSLFGINSLASLKTSVFENMISTDLIGENEPSIKTFISNLSSTIEMRKKGYWNKKAPTIAKCIPWIKSFSPLIDHTMSMAIKDAVICIDDIERKGESLTVNEILGYINFLKEKRNCKIIVIYNSDKMDDDKFSELNEKVIDKRVQLNVSSVECCNFIIPETNPHKELIASYVTSLNLTNMRVIKTINTLSENLQAIVLDLEDETWDKLIKSLCLFCYCQYIVGDHIPTLDFLIEKGKDLPKLFSSNDSGINNIKEQKEFLHKYLFYGMTNLDFIMAQGVKTGFFNEQELIAEVQNVNAQLIKDKKKEASYNIWDSLSDGFNDNEQQVIEDLKSGYFQYKQCMSINDIDYIISIFRQIQQNALAEEIMNDYIHYLSVNKIIINSDNCYYFNQLKDGQFKEAIEALNNKLKPEISLVQAIEHMRYNNSWSSEHEDALASGTIEEYYTFFKSLKRGQIDKYYRGLSIFISSRNSKDSYRVISEKVHFALQKIAKESRLNEIRVKRLGIDIN